MISAGFTGLADRLLAHKIGYLAPDSFNLLISIQLLLMVVVGVSALYMELSTEQYSLVFCHKPWLCYETTFQ